MASVTKFQEFSPEIDDFQIYRERLEQHFEANAIKEENVRIAVLLSSISPAVYKILRDLTFPHLPKEKSYSDLCKILVKQYCIQKSTWRERRNFQNIRQGSHESIIEWYAKIRSAAIDCDFGGRLENVLKDKFVCGLFSSKIFDRLCEEETSTEVTKLINIAQKVEEHVKFGNGGSSINFVARKAPNQDGRQNRTNWSRAVGSANVTCPNARQNRSNWSRSVGVNGTSNVRGQTSAFNNRQMSVNQKGSNVSNQSRFSDFKFKSFKCRTCGNNHKNDCFYKKHICKICKKIGHTEKIGTRDSSAERL